MQVKGEITEHEAVRTLGGCLHPAEDEMDYAPPRPPVYGLTERWPALEAMLPARLPATRVLELPGARVLGKIGWVAVDDRVITSLSWWELGDRVPPIKGIVTKRERRLDGSLLNLASMDAHRNYAHFVMDALGRLSVAELAGIRVEDVDWVLLPRLDTAGTQRMLDAVGIPRRKRLIGRHQVVVTPDVVFAPSMPGTTRVYRSCLPQYLRTLIDPGPPTLRRLYVTRPDTGRRPLTNRADVDRLIIAQGFTPVDPMQVNLAKLMTTADVVIGEHGAALADLAFCRPGTKVIELIPSDHMDPYYFSLSMAADLDYAAVVCRSAELRPPNTPGPSPHSVEVPLDALAEALAALPR
jgi:hypothetical protein